MLSRPTRKLQVTSLMSKIDREMASSKVKKAVLGPNNGQPWIRYLVMANIYIYWVQRGPKSAGLTRSLAYMLIRQVIR